MQVPNWNPVDHEDLRGAEAWTQAVFEKVNSQIDSITLALQGNLSLRENEFTELKQLAMRHEVVTRIELERVKTPIGVLHLDNELFDFGQAVMRRIDEGIVEAKVSFKSAPADEVETLLCFFGG